MATFQSLESRLNKCYLRNIDLQRIIKKQTEEIEQLQAELRRYRLVVVSNE